MLFRSTGFLGMNLIAAADRPLLEKLLYFLVCVIPVTWLTLYSVIKSKRLSEFLDALSDERLPLREKVGAVLSVWRSERKA